MSSAKKIFQKIIVLLCVLMITGCGGKRHRVKRRRRILPTTPYQYEWDKGEENLVKVDTPDTKKPQEDTSVELPATAEPGTIEFDRIEAIVEGPISVERVSTSDIKRRGFDGAPHDLASIIDERLADQKGQEMKMEVSDEDIDRYLSSRQGAPVSKEYLNEMARVHGYSLTEFYDELKRLHRSSNYMDYEVHSRLDVPDDVIQKYYDDNPIMEDGVYFIQTSFVPLQDGKSKEQQLKELQSSKKLAELNLDWTAPLDVKEDEIDSDKEFLLTMKKGGLHILQDFDGFTIYRLHDKVESAPVSLESRRLDILNEIRKAKFTEVLETIKKELRKNVAIYYLNDDASQEPKK